MNLPGFEKGEVLKAADLQALSDAVARFEAGGRLVGEARGEPTWQHELRTPIRHSGDARLAIDFDKPRGSCGDGAYGRPLATGYGYLAGAATPICELRGSEPAIVEKTHEGWRGPLWQTFTVTAKGTVSGDSGVYAGEPKPSKWWGECMEGDGKGALTVLLGCMRCNPCTSTSFGGNLGTRLYFRRHQQVQIPHITVNAKVEDGGCGYAPLVKPHDVSENVSRVRRLAAGAGVRLAVEEDAVRISACGGGLRPINPPGCGGCGDGCCEGEPVGCCCGGDTPAGSCCSAAAKTPAPVELVGEEWPAGAPEGVIIRQLVGLGGAKVRRHVAAEGEAQGKYRCVVDVVAKVPVNAWEECCGGSGDGCGCCGGCVGGCGGCGCMGGGVPAGACVPVQRLRLVTGCEEHTCCKVPVRVLELGGGLRGCEQAKKVVMWLDFEVAACDTQHRAQPGCCGWVQTFFLPAGERAQCGCGERRQLMRYHAGEGYEGQLQVVQQVKRDGLWVMTEEKCFI